MVTWSWETGRITWDNMVVGVQGDNKGTPHGNMVVGVQGDHKGTPLQTP